MNEIAKCLCNDVLRSFKSNSSGLKESSAVRAIEKRDSHIFYFKDLHKIMTARVRRESRYNKTYQNSFSRSRSLHDEHGRGSLTRKRRFIQN